MGGEPHLSSTLTFHTLVDMANDADDQARTCGSKPNVKTDCEDVERPSDIDDYESDDRMFFQHKRGRIVRLEKDRAVDAAQAIADSDNEYWEQGDLKACQLDIPEDVDTETYWHVSPSHNAESILDVNGLMPSESSDCGNTDGQGVYVTRRKDQAVGWAETLAAERTFEQWAVLQVEIPDCMDIGQDTRPINPQNVPDSLVACTAYGIPKDNITLDEEIQRDPSKQQAGGFV